MNVTSAEGCCAICNADPDCRGFSFGTSGQYAQVCWPLAKTTTQTPADGTRVSGSRAGAALPVTIEFTGADGKPATWTPGLADTANLNGTYSDLDCYSTPMQCNDVYHRSMRPGLLSRAGWSVVDDTSTGRLSMLVLRHGRRTGAPIRPSAKSVFEKQPGTRLAHACHAPGTDAEAAHLRGQAKTIVFGVTEASGGTCLAKRKYIF